MADQLRQIVAFVAVAPAGMAALPHNINAAGTRYIPDEVEISNGDFAIISVTNTTVTVQNNGAGVGSCDVLLKLWQSNTRALGANTQVGNFAGGLTPRPFVAAAGSTGGGMDTIYSFVFSANGPDTGNDFSTWSLLAAAVAAIPGPVIITFDDTAGLLVVPAGDWSTMTNVTWRGKFSGFGIQALGTNVEVQEGAILTGTLRFEDNIAVTFSGTTPPIILDDPAGSNCVSITEYSYILCSGAGPFIRFDPGIGLGSVVVDQGGALSTGSTPTVENASGVNVYVTCGEYAEVQSETLTGADPFTVRQSGSSGVINEIQTTATIVHEIPTASRVTGVVVPPGGTAPANSMMFVDPTAGIESIILPPAFQARGQQVIVKNIGASNNTIILNALVGDLVDGAASIVMAGPYCSTILRSDGGTNWYSVSPPLSAQRFTFTAVGGETSPITIPVPGAPRGDANYTVQATVGTDATPPHILNVPNASKTDSVFDLEFDGANLTAGDTIDFTVDQRN